MGLLAKCRQLLGGISRGRSTVTSPPARGLAGNPRPQAPSAGTADGLVSYAPEQDGQPDPGEVVWGWVGFEDDPTQGKDRPVLLLGRRGPDWLGLYLTSKDHDRDAAQEARWGRRWMDVGTGGWDRQRRPSEVRLDRLLVLPGSAIRREGAALERGTFDRVVSAARSFHDLG